LLSCLKIWIRCMELSSIINFPKIGRRFHILRLSHLALGIRILLRESSLWKIGLWMIIQSLIGCQDSSSHKVSWLVFCRLTLESTKLLLISFHLSSRFWILIKIWWVAHQLMVSTFMDYMLMVVAGMNPTTLLLISSQVSFSPRCQLFTLSQLKDMWPQKMIIDALFTRLLWELVFCLPLDNLQTSFCTWTFHQRMRDQNSGP